MSDVMNAARRLWTLYEPYHALTYFAPEADQAFTDAGLRGFWRGYFAGRAAPLGAVGPGVVTALFYGFRPDFVARALPSVWSMAEPARALEARLAGVDAALRRIFGDELGAPWFAEAARLLRAGLEACGGAGRPLFAANCDLQWPEDAHLALWHATTLAREHRGDGHVAALVTAELDACESHLTRLAYDGTAPDRIEATRGWSEEDWNTTAERLRMRGYLGADGRLTAEGRAVRQRVEEETDQLAAGALRVLGRDELDRLERNLGILAARVTAAGVIRYPNPIGLPLPG
jgi:hypothetical protein